MNIRTDWSFDEFFSSDKEFLDFLNITKEQIASLKDNFDNLSLADKLQKYYKLKLDIERLTTYSELKSDLDISNETYLGYKNQVTIIKSELDYFVNIINDEILKIDISLDDYIKKNPELNDYYMHLYEILRLKEHSISSTTVSNETSLINNVNNIYNTIMNVEFPAQSTTIDDKEVKVNRTIYSQYIKNADRQIRKDVFKAYSKGLEKVSKSISQLFNMRYQLCYDIAKEKGYKSILEQVLTEDDLNDNIITNLINSVHDNLHLLKRYIDLKKKKMDLKELHYYDFSINSDYNPKYSFDEAIATIKDALKPLGDDYQKTLDTVLSGGMLDIYPSKHKFGGGYHFRNYTKPMILMNYKENFREVATIGHELGHAVNGIKVRDHNAYQNFHFSVFLSEIASTVNEDRVQKYMYKSAEAENKIIHLEQIIDLIIASVFTQTMYLEFQKILCNKIENNEVINSDIINNTFLELFTKYYQGMTIDEELKYLWQTRLHLFYGPYRYYNFQYATGKICSLAINKAIDENNIDNYLNFLSIGGSKPTLEALKIAGVDLLDEQPFNNAMANIESLIDDYELLLKK